MEKIVWILKIRKNCKIWPYHGMNQEFFENIKNKLFHYAWFFMKKINDFDVSVEIKLK